METITVQVIINASVESVWQKWTNPEDVMQWNNASPDWHTPKAENDLRVGGQFLYRMEARDGSFGFDFIGKYTDVQTHKRIAYVLEDGRKVTVSFTHENGNTLVSESFDPEGVNSPELQRQGWQAILDNFKRHVELNL